jgi:hypothetical protein
VGGRRFDGRSREDRVRIVVAAYALSSLMFSATEADAWGASGHAIVAELAQHRLTQSALREVRQLLGEKVSLASVANWADTIAATRTETQDWHFVEIPLGATSYDTARDCGPTRRGDCIVKAIERQRATLAGTTARAEALRFLVHLVGDIHQPLHCAERRDDAGGNELKITWFGSRISLHELWDVELIEHRTYDWGDYVDYLESRILTQKGFDGLRFGTPAEWAWEGHEAAVQAAYALPANLDLGRDYYEQSRPTVERHLALAGIRLAELLNEAFK